MWEIPFKHTIHHQKTSIFIDPNTTVSNILPIIHAHIRLVMELEPEEYQIYSQNHIQQKIILSEFNTAFKYVYNQQTAFYIEPLRTYVPERVQYLITRDHICRIQRWWRKQKCEECPVCLCRGQSGNNNNYTCSHFICNRCYQNWSIHRNHQTCPVCRANSRTIPDDNIYINYDTDMNINDMNINDININDMNNNYININDMNNNDININDININDMIINYMGINTDNNTNTNIIQMLTRNYNNNLNNDINNIISQIH